MDTPIISSSTIYWINVLNGLHILSIITASIVFVGILAYLFTCEGMKYNPKVIISMTVGFIIFILFAIFCPDKETLMEMLVFDKITPANINTAINEVKELIDYIIQVCK